MSSLLLLCIFSLVTICLSSNIVHKDGRVEILIRGSKVLRVMDNTMEPAVYSQNGKYYTCTDLLTLENCNNVCECIREKCWSR